MALPARRILIIDDHSFFSDCLRTLIEREIPRAVCQLLDSGVAVADRLRQFQPDLLVVDLSLGATNGYELAESLRQGGVGTPILFASTGAPLSRRLLMRLRPAAFVSKGVAPRRLVSRIVRLLDSLSSARGEPQLA